MSLTVNQRPSTTISGETSTWNAIAHPLLYKMQRKDFTFASITNSGGFVRLVLDASFGDVSASFDVSDIVYFITDGGVYDTTGTVSASSYSAPNTLVTLSTAYISSSTGFVNNDNLRPLYRVEIEVYNSSNVLLNASPFPYAPDSEGLASMDVSSILRAQLSPDINADLTGTTKTFDDSTAYIKFYIKYREVWTGSAESQTNDSANQFFAVLGALQIPSAYGSNMALYATFTDGGPTGLFLTKLTNIIFWRGYPNLVSVIIGENMSTNVFAQAGSDTSTATAYAGKIVDIDLKPLITDETVSTTTLLVKRDDAVDVTITETKTVKLRDACAQPILLMARNTLGGVLCWLFDVNQEYSFDYGNNIKAKRLVLNTNNLTMNEWEALQDFVTLGQEYRVSITEFTSSTIKSNARIGQQAYVVSSAGVKTGVLVLPSRNKTFTKQVKNTFELEIEYPEVFTP